MISEYACNFDKIDAKLHITNPWLGLIDPVHGTWVSGQRIPPHTVVELVAGDTLQLGASKREYRLQWLSFSEAFEMEDLLPPLVEEEKEEVHAHQVNNSLCSVQNL